MPEFTCRAWARVTLSKLDAQHSESPPSTSGPLGENALHVLGPCVTPTHRVLLDTNLYRAAKSRYRLTRTHRVDGRHEAAAGVLALEGRVAVAEGHRPALGPQDGVVELEERARVQPQPEPGVARVKGSGISQSQGFENYGKDGR